MTGIGQSCERRKKRAVCNNRRKKHEVYREVDSSFSESYQNKMGQYSKGGDVCCSKTKKNCNMYSERGRCPRAIGEEWDSKKEGCQLVFRF